MRAPVLSERRRPRAANRSGVESDERIAPVQARGIEQRRRVGAVLRAQMERRERVENRATEGARDPKERLDVMGLGWGRLNRMRQEPGAPVRRVSDAKSGSTQERKSRGVERFLEQNGQVEPTASQHRRESETPCKPAMRSGAVIFDEVIVAWVAPQCIEDPALGEDRDARLREVRPNGSHRW